MADGRKESKKKTKELHRGIETGMVVSEVVAARDQNFSERESGTVMTKRWPYDHYTGRSLARC